MESIAADRKLAETTGHAYWRCLEELADQPAFEDLLRRTFPGRVVDAWLEPHSRRHFLTLMGASLGLAGLAGCGVQPPAETIVPQVRPTEAIVPGKPLFFATAVSLAGETTGLLVESHEGRPTKIEGNPDHPHSRGATDLFAQAEILTLYDPDRSQNVVAAGEIRTWDDATAALRAAMVQQRAKNGAGLRLLTETVVSPTLAGQIDVLLTSLPAAKWIQYEPAARDAARQGAIMAFGRDVRSQYHFDRADVVLSLEADFLAPPGNARHVREFAARRAAHGATEPKQATMNRLYVVECTPGLTGAKADHRWALRAGEVEAFARALAVRLDPKLERLGESGSHPVPLTALDAIARDLEAHRGKCIVAAGDYQPAAVHALAHAMNRTLDNAGQTVSYTEPVETASTDQSASLADLAREMERGEVEMLLILGANVAYGAPADLDFAARLAKVPLAVHWGLYHDETAAACNWHIPAAHFLESWSDALASDGTASIVQPLIAPLYGGKSAHELLSLLSEAVERTSHDLVREYWRRRWSARNPTGDFQSFWETTVHDGIVHDAALPDITPSLQENWPSRLAPTRAAARSHEPSTGQFAGDDYEIVFRLDPTIFDGRFANNGWLQECPKPLTKLTWDNAVLISPNTAKRLKLQAAFTGHGGEHGDVLVDVVELHYAGRTLEAPVWILPGQPDGSVTLPLGYGRTRAGRVGTGVGFNAYQLRTSRAPWSDMGLTIRKTGKQVSLACTQYHNRMEDRKLVRSATLDEFHANPAFAKQTAESGGPAQPEEQLPTLYQPEEHPYNGYKWGMSIDLPRCIGCNACVVACQAENNIPVVGKEQVMRGREMHWIRLDRYYRGPAERPETFFQPVPCMQCENAPCELVCPVGATVHSDEGLNDMVYNRCVGTRYCSNNCPYKVRRFNFLQFADFTTPSLKLLHNPDVTVRSRGVMEKCTYCVQRITQARIQAEKEDRPIRDGEILTACQAVCPAQAIAFGNLNDPKSAVSRRKASPLDYALLEELNTRPRTTYLANLRNPNPDIA